VGAAARHLESPVSPVPEAFSSRVVPARWWLASGAALALTAAWLLFSESAPLAVTLPLLTLVVAVGVLALLLWKRRRGLVPWFEIGIVYTSVVALYGVYGLARFLVLGEHYFPPDDSPLYDYRWPSLDPSTAEVSFVGWIFVAHLVAFVVVYLPVRGRLTASTHRLPPPSTPVLIAVVTIYVLVQGFWFFLGLFFNTTADTYADVYLIAQRLPLILAQLLNHLNGAKYPLSLVILAGLFAKYPASRAYIVMWIGALTALTVVRLGSRSELALLIMASAMMYHAMVRPISPRPIVAGVTMGVIAFTVLGMMRMGISGGAAINPLLYPTEFDTLFANTIELARAHERGTIRDLPMAFYFADFAALVPQQVAPFQKVDPAAWYVTTFYPAYAATGGGLAFGTMSEAVLTGGILSAALRGAALGFCFAKIHRLYERRPGNFWVFVFYVWVTTLSYQSFRATTFLLLVYFAFRFVPVMIGVKLISSLLQRASRPEPSVQPGMART
jgi:hypothetical protein